MTQDSEALDKMDMNSSPKEAIHSGHFMVSDIDDSEVQDDEESVSVPVSEGEDRTPPEEPTKGYDFDDAPKETSNTYNFGPRCSMSVSIDATLSKLFQCMTLAYSGKLTSPKWKTFKGMKLRWKDKIRLNNVIWRAWHLQFVRRHYPKVCQFASPIDSDAHNKPESVVLEGKYWKRRLDTVCAEYKTWRLFFKRKLSKQFIAEREDSSSTDINAFDWQPRTNLSAYSSTSMVVDDDPFSDFTDTLFSFIPNQPFAFPNPREIARAGIADFIQPGLIQFQPNLDDFMMDNFEMLASKLPTVVEENDANMLGDLLDNAASHNTQSDFIDIDLLVPPFGQRVVDSLGSQDAGSTQSLYRQDVATASEARAESFPGGRLNSSYALPASPEPSTVAMDTDLAASMTPRTEELSSMLKEERASLYATCQTRNSLCMPKQVRNSHAAPLLRPSSLSNRKTSTGRSVVEVGPFSTSAENLPQGHANVQPAITPPSSSVKYSSTVPSAVQGGLKSGPRPLLTGSGRYGATSTKTLSDILQTPTTDFVGNGLGTVVHSPVTVLNQAPSITPSEDVLLRIQCNSDGGSVRRASAGPDGIGMMKNQDDVFAVPKPKHRARSQSGPNLGQSQAVPSKASLTVGLSLSTSSVLNSTTSKPVTAPSPQQPPVLLPGATVDSSRAILPSFPPHSAVLADLLTKGTSHNLKKASAPVSKSASPIPILPSPSTQTVVISPFTLATVSGMNELQSRVLVGATSQVFGGMVPPGKVVLSTDWRQIVGQRECTYEGNWCATGTIPTASPYPPVTSISCDPKANSLPKSSKPKQSSDKVHYKEIRRKCHINAEHKRRCNIKNGFDMLHSLVPSLSQNPNSKVSKAAMLQRAAEHIKQLKIERAQLQEQSESLKKQVETLNQAINMCQAQLPATGVPVSCQRPNKLHKMFEDYVRSRTLQNWKFWIFSILIRPLLDSYNGTVSTTSIDDLCKTVLTWLEQHCSLVALRPAVFHSLRHLSTTTNILTDPAQMPEEAAKAVTNL